MADDKRRTTSKQPQPKSVTNNIINKHPRLLQYPRSKGPGDVDIVFQKNITSKGVNAMRGEIPTPSPKPSAGSVTTKKNTYRENK